MIETNTYRFVVRIFIGLGLSISLTGVIMVMAPIALGAPYLVFIAWSIVKFFRCAYVTERYSEYVSFSLQNMLTLIYSSSYVMTTYSLHLEHNYTLPKAMIESPLLLLPLCAIHDHAYFRREFINPFWIRKMHVETICNPMLSSHQAPLIALGVIAAIFRIIQPQILQYEYGFSVTAVLMYAFLFLFLLNLRPAISGLKHLKKQEAREKSEFTFFNIDEIRTFRQKSITARCTAWVNSQLLHLKNINSK